MSFIALFLPACISLMIRHKRNKELSWRIPESILEYAVCVIFNVLLSQCIIVYVLRIDAVDITAFRSFPFFTKYMVISLFVAWLMPYVVEIGHKYIKVSFSVDSRACECDNRMEQGK